MYSHVVTSLLCSKKLTWIVLQKKNGLLTNTWWRIQHLITDRQTMMAEITSKIVPVELQCSLTINTQQPNIRLTIKSQQNELVCTIESPRVSISGEWQKWKMLVKGPRRRCRKRQEMGSCHSLESPVREGLVNQLNQDRKLQCQATYRGRVFIVRLKNEGNGTFVFLGSALSWTPAGGSAGH